MAAVTTLQSSPISAFNLNNLKWVHIEGGPEFDYPINYWLADSRRKTRGRLPGLSRQTGA